MNIIVDILTDMENFKRKSNEQILQEIFEEAWPHLAKKRAKNKPAKSEKLALDTDLGSFSANFDDLAVLKNGKVSVPYLMRKIKCTYSASCDKTKELVNATE